MSHLFPRILCAFLLAVVLSSAWGVAQDQAAKDQPPEPPKVEPARNQPDPEQPAVVITPSGEPAESETTESEPAPGDAEPSFEPVPSVSGSVSAIPRLLAANKDYKQGDLLTWELVKPVLDRLRRAKVPMPPEKELKQKFLSVNDPLVKTFGTKDGKAFFQKLSQNPASIDRVDHYRKLPYGNQFLNEMIGDVDGYKFFTTQTWLDERDAKWAERNTLAKVKGGQKFGEPTGRIYLESQLIDFLASYKKSGKTRSYE